MHANRSRVDLVAAGLLLAVMLQSARAATIVVDTLVDVVDAQDGVCSLREAWANADANGGGSADCAAGDGADTITFAAQLFSGEPASARIDLSPTHGTLQTGFGSGNLTIAAPAGTTLVIAGAGDHQLLRLGAGEDAFVARDLELRGGRGSGGGAVHVVQIGPVTFERVRFVDNVASSWLGGGALLRNLASGGAALTFRDCSFEDNHAPAGSGGALALLGDGSFDTRIEDGVFEGNSAGSAGGAVTIGIGALSDAGTPSVAIAGTLFAGNQADYGGAVHASAHDGAGRLRLSLVGAALLDNAATQGGGALSIVGGSEPEATSVQVRSSSFADNSVSGGKGGGVHAVDAQVLVDNSVFAFNTSSFGGAALAVDGSGSPPRRLHLAGNTFYRNAPLDSGATAPRSVSLVAGFPDSSTWSWTIAGNVFVRDQTVGGDADECMLQPAAPASPQVSGVANVADHGSCLFTAGDLLAPPQLELSSAGGIHPWTLVPAAGSAAIDAWPSDACNGIDGAPLADDIGGAARPQDGDADGSTDCDAGAFERRSAEVFANGFE